MTRIGYFCPNCGALIRNKKVRGKLIECACKPARYGAHAWDKTRESDEWIRECQSMWEPVYRDASKKHKYRKCWHPPVNSW